MKNSKDSESSKELICPKCQSKNIVKKIEAQEEGVISEASFSCADCKTQVDYWAYGMYESDLFKEDPND